MSDPGFNTPTHELGTGNEHGSRSRLHTRNSQQPLKPALKGLHLPENGICHRICDRLRNHPLVAVVIVVGIIVIGFSQFVDALKALNSLTTSKTETSSTPSPAQAASASAEARRDACVDRLVREFKATQPFAQNGGVSCAGAGPSTRGERNSAIVTYTAPPGFQIVGAPHVQERSNSHGGYGDIAYQKENDLVSQVSVPVHCRSEDKLFGSGGSEQITVAGQIERIVQPEVTARFKAQCAAETHLP